MYSRSSAGSKIRCCVHDLLERRARIDCCRGQDRCGRFDFASSSATRTLLPATENAITGARLGMALTLHRRHRFLTATYRVSIACIERPSSISAIVNRCMSNLPPTRSNYRSRAAAGCPSRDCVYRQHQASFPAGHVWSEKLRMTGCRNGIKSSRKCRNTSIWV